MKQMQRENKQKEESKRISLLKKQRAALLDEEGEVPESSESVEEPELPNYRR